MHKMHMEWLNLNRDPQLPTFLANRILKLPIGIWMPNFLQNFNSHFAGSWNSKIFVAI